MAGLRRGEIIALQWQDVDFKNNQIYVAPQKTDNYRYVPMAADLRIALAAHPKTQKIPYIISLGLNNREKRTTKAYLSSFYSEVRDKAGLGKKGSIHTLRHTFASPLVQAGVDLYSVSKLLGHTSIKTTEIYAHLAPKTLQDCLGP